MGFWGGGKEMGGGEGGIDGLRAIAVERRVEKLRFVSLFI